MDAVETARSEWAKGEMYEPYVGRWSRPVAAQFLHWLAPPTQAAWLDVGCGTGALCQTILEWTDPRSVKGVDRSQDYVGFARRRLPDPHLSLEVGDAQGLPVDTCEFDAVVSGLVLNFIPEPARMVSEMARAVRPGGSVALYVWDYGGRTQFMRHFWNAAAALDSAALALDEGRLFPICSPDRLRDLFDTAGLLAVETTPIDIDTVFSDFDDYWRPFLGAQGPAPSYTMSLTETAREQLREHLRASLPFAVDGSIPLVARAWAVKGRKPS